ncbi:MAG: polysaccharide pyruvyl transferase family protein [Oscillospiraceae bacterium]|nr:polysaccharide pyruvyl transferase family protein [Oscillospiraceae bacterium]
MNKVSIFTNYKVTTNYGATLQAYSLNYFIRKKGIDCKTVGVIPDKVSRRKIRSRMPKNFKSIQGIIRIIARKLNRLIIRKTLVVRNQTFEKFRDNFIPHTGIITRQDVLDHKESYNVAICGSDQIWRPTLDGKMDDVMWLSGIACEKKIAYAPSLGVEKLSDSQLKFAEIALEDFHSVSVREKSAVTLLQPICSKTVTHVLDPVFLVSKDEWEKFSCNEISNDRNYIFIYFIHPSKKIYREVSKIAKKLDLDVVTIPYNSFFNTSDMLFKGRKEMNCSPQKFIRLIMDAELVVTDSFHATAFSILLNTKFYYSATNFATRGRSLLNDFQLDNRIISEESDIRLDEEIDWTNVNTILKRRIADSEDFLMNSLNECNAV